MTDKRDVKLARKAREQKFEPVTVAFTGKIVSRNGSVAVPGVFNHVWVLATDTAEPEAVYNRRVKDTRPGLPVVVGYAPKSKTLEILQTDVEHLAGFYETGGLDTQRHADTHLDTGDDPVYVNRRMITDQLYVAPGSGLAVNVSPYEYDVDGVRKYFPGQNNYSLAASKPAAGLARYVLVYLNKATNALGVVDGATVPDLDWFIPAKPDTPAGGEAAAYVRIDGAQTGFGQADIADGRRLFGGGGGGGFNFPKIKTVASSGADYTSIKTALSVVLAGTVVLQMETVTEDGFTVGADRSVQNLSPSEFRISVPNGVSLDADTVYGVRVTPGGNIFEANIFCSHNATNTYALYLFNATVERVLARASGGTNRYGIVIEENGTLNELLYCRGEAGTATGESVGLWLQEGSSILRVLGGQYSGETADIRVSAGASVELQGPVLTHGTIDNDGGTVTGWWYDADSNLRFAPGSGLQGGVWLHKADGMQLWYADLDSAIAAADSFEGVEFVHDLELAGLEIDKPVVLRGNNHIITSTGVELAAGIAAGCSITASAMIEDVQVDSTSTETNNIGISIDSSPTLKRVAAMASDGTNRFGGFTEVGDEAILEDCDFSARDGTVNYGLWTNGARIIRGRYEGSDADIYVATGASVRLEGPVLTNGLLVLDSGASWTGWYYDGNGNLIEKRIVEAPQYDYPLKDTANACGVATHFRTTGSGTPTGWTAVDAAASSVQNSIYASGWTIGQTSGDSTFDYKIKSSINIENLGANVFSSFVFGQVFPRSFAYGGDKDWYFSIHRDNAGTMDTETYMRIQLHWDNTTSQFQVTALRKDGTTETPGTTYNIPVPIDKEFWFRITLLNSTNKLVRGYFGPGYHADTQWNLMSANIGSSVTWGLVWYRIHGNSGSGYAANPNITIGYVDYIAGQP